MLAECFCEQAHAEELLRRIQYPRGLVPDWQSFANAAQYWACVLTEIENGRLPEGGPERLAAAARDEYPGNRFFLQAAGHQPEQPSEVPSPHDRSGDQVEEWPTLIFHGGDDPDAFLRLVREMVEPQAQLLYATQWEVAVELAGVGGDETADLVTQLQRAVDQLSLPDNAHVEVRFERYGYRPQLIERLRVTGPDLRRYSLENVPNTTPVRDVADSVLAYYREGAQADWLGQGRRVVVDRVLPGSTPGWESRQYPLGLDLSLEEAGVTEGDELRVQGEALPGGGPAEDALGAAGTGGNDQLRISSADTAAGGGGINPLVAPQYRVLIDFGVESLDLRQFSFIFTAMDELCATLGSAMAVKNNSDPSTVRPPQILSVNMRSPLAVELGETLASGGASVAVLRVLAAVLRDPGLLGGFLPKIKTGWYDARTAQYEAQLRLNMIRQSAGKINVRVLSPDPESEPEKLRLISSPKLNTGVKRPELP